MNRVLREAKCIIRRMQANGYDGDFAIIPETVMAEIQVTCGRTIAENVIYQEVIRDLIDGKDICSYCEDCEECENKTGKCQDFMLRFPDNETAAGAFNECYRSLQRVLRDCKEAHDGQTV